MGFGFRVGAFNRALWCLSFVSGISLSADLSVLGFAGGLGLALSLSRSPRLRPSGLSDCRRRLLCSQQSCFGVTSLLFCSASLGRSVFRSPRRRSSVDTRRSFGHGL